MNRLLVVGALLLSQIAIAQYSPNVPLDLQRMTIDQKSWITSEGFPLSSYDYTNPTINLELSTALTEKKQGDLFTKIGWVAVGVGAIWRLAPLMVEDLEIENPSFGTLLLAGGLTLNLTGMYKKIQAKKRVQNASYLYNE